MRRSLFLLSAAAHTLLTSASRRVLVTGGNKGIGLQICRRILRDHPDTSVILGARNPGRGEAAVKQLIKEDPKNDGRVEALELDVTNEDSVRAAAKRLREKEPGPPLYGLVNNAGVGFGYSIPDTLNTNFYGVQRVCDAFIPLIQPEGGRVVNIASASGPNFVRNLDKAEQSLFMSAGTTREQLEAIIQRYVQSGRSSDAYGLSKACLNTYTRQLSRRFPGLRINSCSPGYILTDLTAGMGASTPPEQSNCHVAPLFLLFDEPEGNGRYYGSDAVRSPLHYYRGPGDPPYVADD